MTINDQIRDEKLQYDINREAAKISALSSGKIHKYEYLTGEDILPSNQQQIIEQAKFTYSPLGKAFEKQIKTIEDKGQKQSDALENLKDQNKQIVNVNDDYEDKLLHSKEREIFRNIYNKRLDKIEELTKIIDGSSLIFTTVSTGKTFGFTKKDDPLTFLNKIRNGQITMEEAKESQKDFDKHLKIARKGNKNHEQKKRVANLNMLFNGRNEAIRFIHGYGSMILEAKKWLLKCKQNKVEQVLKY